MSLLRRGIISSALDSGGAIYSAKAASFNGVDQYFETTSNISFSGYSSAMSISIMIDNDSGADQRYINAWGGAGGNVFYVESTSSSNLVVNISGLTFTQTQPAGATGWRRITLVWNGTNLKYYEGSSLVSTVDGGGTMPSLSRKVAIGRQLNTSVVSVGGTGFCALWNSELTQSDVTALDNSDDSLCYESLGNLQTGLQHYWYLGNFEGHLSQELTDQAGSNDLINYNTTPFTKTGLNVECGGSPPVADDYLFLPNITIY